MPFSPFNSSNIPANLFESLLFGYKKGAYTGAVADKKGIFEEADGGTIFFDEIANLTDETQSKILRVLQEKEIQPLGSNQIKKVDVRILAATNIDLLAKVKSGEFREDLYYRLNIINIHLPPLRERKEDIPLLADDLPEEVRPREQESDQGHEPQVPAPADGLQLAGQHPRAAEHHAARRAAFQRRDPHPGGPDPRDPRRAQPAAGKRAASTRKWTPSSDS